MTDDIMEKTFKDNGISDDDVLSFSDGLESCLKQWEQLKSGKLHTILCT